MVAVVALGWEGFGGDLVEGWHRRVRPLQVAGGDLEGVEDERGVARGNDLLAEGADDGVEDEIDGVGVVDGRKREIGEEASGGVVEGLVDAGDFTDGGDANRVLGQVAAPLNGGEADGVRGFRVGLVEVAALLAFEGEALADDAVGFDEGASG